MKEMTALEVLTTTRAVRRRLDFDRPVPDDVVLKAIEVALQAPIGGSIEPWRWIVITDADQKRRLADLYRSTAMDIFHKSREEAVTDQSRRAYDGAIYLAENLERVPVLVVPCALGPAPEHPVQALGFFGSIIPAVWSFQLALRSQGLGSVYTTAILREQAQLVDILALPHDVTPAALIPVAYTKGLNFRPARRSPAKDVTYFEAWGRSRER